ncbi:mirror-image polydactyly gene 1 protein isoform X2 [Syngnathus scovelli]|uniref:mirror-image polydactyly gene 1 protein isoform X2 n=1 Tax=Syngnathus scovelli TaxID=161590 RepID=UPI0035CA8D47
MRTWMLPLLLKTTALLRCAAWCLFGTLVSRSEANGMLTRAETLTTHERAGIIANDVSSSLTRAVTFPSGHRDAAIGHRAAYGEAPPPDADRKMSLLLRELDALRDANKKLLERLSLKEEELQSKEAELMANTKQAKDWEGPSGPTRVTARPSATVTWKRRSSWVTFVRRSRRRKWPTWVGPWWSTCGWPRSAGATWPRRRWRLSWSSETARSPRCSLRCQRHSLTGPQCRRLQQEVLREREQRPSKEELIKLQRERDAALDDRGRLEAELMQANHRFEQLAKAPPPDDDDGHSRAPPLLAQLQQLTEDKHSVEAELLLSQEAERDARERVQRLERLVEVLRKKVGTGSLRPVV